MIWIIGAGLMAREYAKVLSAMQVPFTVIGRAKENCDTIAEEYKCPCVAGGLSQYLKSNPGKPAQAIIAVGIEALAETTLQLLEYGVLEVLLEKPGVGYVSEIDELVSKARERKATVLLAYNRRFYGSVIKAKKIIAQDGGVSSFIFEFTEWSNVIRGLQKHPAEHHNWFLGNSTHVVDTAFYLGGKPEQLCAYVKGSLDWHPASAIFSGAGVTNQGALFSYAANWQGPGRWSVEMITPKSRLIFKPMEKLQLQKIDTVAIEAVDLDDDLDIRFKPGLFRQVGAFIGRDYANFCTLEEQKENIERFYLKMSNYKN